MSIGEVLTQVAQNPATHVTGALIAGTLLQKFFNVLGFLGSFFQSKPNVLPDLLQILKDMQAGQAALPDILKLLQELKTNAAAAKVN